jgi:hypothetical protein
MGTEEKLIPFFRDAPSHKKTDTEFHAWFNAADSVETSVKTGFIDFAHKIFTQDFYDYVGDPTTKTCCEIGFGGGRLLLPASCFFGHAHGIDIHDEFSRVMTHMRSSGRKNFTLHTQDDAIGGSIKDASVDFFYSFITFQHFPNWDTAIKYFELISRALTPEGCGIIYFGHNTFNDNKIYIEKPQTFNDFPMILHVQPSLAQIEMKKRGLNTYSMDVPTKNMWSKSPSRQFYVKFKRTK